MYLCYHEDPRPKKSCATYLKKWKLYANREQFDPVSLSLTQAINFLAELHKDNALFLAICIATQSCYLHFESLNQIYW